MTRAQYQIISHKVLWPMLRRNGLASPRTAVGHFQPKSDG
jgi:hypothetical protein